MTLNGVSISVGTEIIYRGQWASVSEISEEYQMVYVLDQDGGEHEISVNDSDVNHVFDNTAFNPKYKLSDSVIDYFAVCYYAWLKKTQDKKDSSVSVYRPTN